METLSASKKLGLHKEEAMQITINGGLYVQDHLKKIGDGGESVVYKLRDKAIKIFTLPKDTLQKKASMLDAYFKHQSTLYAGLEDVAAIPKGKVLNTSTSETIGFTMELCEGWWNLYDFADPDFRKQHGLGFPDIALLFMEINHGLKLIHEKGFVLGDLNIRNVLIKPKAFDDPDPYFAIRILDTDSWGIERPDLGLSFQPSAQDNSIMHPHRRKALEEKRPAPKFQQKEDWWSFTLLLAQCLLSFDPFFAGMTKKDLDRDERSMTGYTVWLSNVRGSRSQTIAAVRIGSKLQMLMHRWLKCLTEGEFPMEALLDFYRSIVRCKGKDHQGKDCNWQFHKSTRFCPNCGTICA